MTYRPIIPFRFYMSACGANMIWINVRFSLRVTASAASRGANRWPVRAIMLLFVGVGLGGCAQVSLHPEVTLAQEDPGYAPAAVDHAVDSFLGDWGAGGGGAAGGGIGSVGGTPDYRTEKSLETTIGLRVRRRLDPGWELEGAIRGGRGQGRHALPGGAGVFKDPISIAAETGFAEAEAMITRRLGPGVLPEALPGSLSLSAGLGVRQVSSRMRIDSALLAIDTSHRQRLEFGTLGARYEVPFARGGGTLALFFEARGHGRDSGLLRGGARLILSRPR